MSSSLLALRTLLNHIDHRRELQQRPEEREALVVRLWEAQAGHRQEEVAAQELHQAALVALKKVRVLVPEEQRLG